ncbi:MAG: hypothetical protein JST68_11970 [Bacteroidetes bacterium]|nr:hypothetical protein [Bacteroidota bacterium]
MRKINILLAAFIAACVLLAMPSCKKGDTGPAGPAGQNGTNGSTILSGNGAPSASTGNNGDFYLDLSTQLLYGPKTASGWGTGTLLKGNANVMIDTFTIKKTDWVYSAVYWFATSDGSSQGYVAKYFDHSQALITHDLLNTGMITVYGQTDAGLQPNTYTTLPYSFMENFSAAYSFNYTYTTTPGKIRLFFFFSKNTAAAPTLSTYVPPPLKVKLAMVTGTIVAEAKQLIQQRTAGKYIP